MILNFKLSKKTACVATALALCESPILAQIQISESYYTAQETSPRVLESETPETDSNSSSENPNALRDDTQSGMPLDEKSRQPEISNQLEKGDQENPEEESKSILFSADFGMQSAFPSTKLISFGPKYGLALEGKVLGSMQLDKFMFDGAFGWYFFNLSGKEPRRINGVVLTDDNDFDIVDELGIKLSGAIVEFAPSYFIREDIFTGLVLQARYPSDLGYDSLVARNKIGWSMGLQAGYQILEKELDTRLVGRLMTTVNDVNWISTSAMFGIQIGLPVSQKAPRPELETSQTELFNKAPDIMTADENPNDQKLEAPKSGFTRRLFRIQLDGEFTKLALEDLITFYDVTGYPTLTQEAQSFLMSFGETLLNSNNEWENLNIENVTSDQALVIRDALVSAGVSASKIKLGTSGVAQYIPNPDAEIRFYGTKNDSFASTLRRLMRDLKIQESE